MPPRFRIRMVTRYGTLYEGQAEYLRVPVADGTIGILPHHAPLVTVLHYGRIDLRRPGEKELDYYSCTGGVLHVSPDGAVELYVDAGEKAESIDIHRAREAERRARERLQRAGSARDIDLDRAVAALQRALAREKVYSTVHQHVPRRGGPGG